MDIVGISSAALTQWVVPTELKKCVLLVLGSPREWNPRPLEPKSAIITTEPRRIPYTGFYYLYNYLSYPPSC